MIYLRRKGFTLVEFLVAMLMGGMIALTMGIMLTDFNALILRAHERSALSIDYQIGKAMLKRELKEADAEFDLKAGEMSFTNTDGQDVRIYYDANREEIRVEHNGALQYIALTDVIDMEFSFAEIDEDAGYVSELVTSLYFDMEKESVYTAGEPIVERSTDTFNVFLRNK